MTTILVDHNMEGQADLLFDVLHVQGWADLLDIHFARFSDIGLDKAATDRAVWQHTQSQRMMLLTANRSMTGPDSLEQTIREERTDTSLPILTVSMVERLGETAYRELVRSGSPRSS